MAPYRVLIVIPGAGIGGIATGLLGVLKHLPKRQYQIVVATLQMRSVVKLLRKHGIRCIVLPSKNRLRYLQNFIAREKIQLIQSCDSASEGAFVAQQLGLPHIWYVGTNVELAFKAPSKESLKAFRFMIDRLSNKVVVQSRALAKDVFPSLAKDRLCVIPWGVEKNTSSRLHSKGWLKKKLGFRNDSPLIAMVGNFYPAKRHLDFIKAASMIYQKVPRARFLIAGNTVGNSSSAYRTSAQYRKRIVNSVRQLKLQKVLVMTNFSYDARQSWYGGLNLLVVPSYEGMSQAMLEAGINRVPIVAANIGGVRDVIQNGRSGLLVPYRNPEKIAKAVIEILNDQKLKNRLGKNIHHRIVTKFSARKHARKFDRLYQSLL